MVKYCLEKYPKGSWKRQQSDGRFMDGWLYKNLELLATKISKDMTFMGVIYSSTLEVGTGKSVLATQIGEAWTEIINKMYKKEIKYDVNNIVWRPKQLIERAFQIPKYSYILLDEWEDSSYWSELGMTLRQFFRKCRQLNLFIMCIIPNWFQLPLSYAVSRSIFAIDVRFNDKLDRGFFAFYNFPAKRALYVIGKRTHNYWAAKPTFMGKFPDGYGVNEKKYRKMKYEDMLKYEEENPVKMNKAQIEKATRIAMLKQFMKTMPNLSNPALGKILGVSDVCILRWKKGDVEYPKATHNNYNKVLTLSKEKELEVDEEELIKNDHEVKTFVEEEESD